MSSLELDGRDPMSSGFSLTETDSATPVVDTVPYFVRISELFDLDRTQAELDFVDVDAEGDTPLFVDPRAMQRMPGEWAEDGVELLREFFTRVLAAIREERRDDGLTLLLGLGEPNEAHLGFSTGRKARGSAIGPRLAEAVWDALSQSEAAQTGLLHDLEDTALLVEGIDIDRVSDITINVIREKLIEYTQEAAEYYGIPMHELGSGSIWDPQTGEWEAEEYVRLPKTPTGPLILVPKAIVRMKLDFDPGEYYRHYILRHLEQLELQSPGSSLVYTLKGTGEARVHKTKLDERTRRRFKKEKSANVRITLQNREILEHYRAEKERPGNQREPLSFLEFSAKTGSDPPDWDALLSAVTDTPTGGDNAGRYHGAVEALLTALFWPTLTYMRKESELHQGRKRVDLRYTNLAISGFFAWVANNYPPQPYIFVECKNYSADLGNDALDQLTGRFSAGTRGHVGLLVCRAFDDKERFIERCRDAALDRRGYVIVIDDGDLAELARARRDDNSVAFFGLLDERFARLVN